MPQNQPPATAPEPKAAHPTPPGRGTRMTAAAPLRSMRHPACRMRAAPTMFMAVATTLFSLLLFAYAMRMRALAADPASGPAGGTRARWRWPASRCNAPGGWRTAMWLVAGGVLAAVFVIGQLVAWQMLSAAGETVTVNPSNSFSTCSPACTDCPCMAGRRGRDDRATPARGPVQARAVAMRALLAFPARGLARAAGGNAVADPGSSPPSAGLYGPRHDRRRRPPESAAESSAVAARRRAATAGAASSPTGRPTARSLQVPWGKAMMWIFLLSDTFVFSSFLIGYMTVRMSTTAPWPIPRRCSQSGGVEVPLLLIAIMTFTLISSSGTMAVNWLPAQRTAGCRVVADDRVAGRGLRVRRSNGAT